MNYSEIHFPISKYRKTRLFLTTLIYMLDNKTSLFIIIFIIICSLEIEPRALLGKCSTPEPQSQRPVKNVV